MSHHDVRNHATAGPAHRAPAEELAAYGSALGLTLSHPRTARSHDPADSYTTPRCPAPSPRTAGRPRRSVQTDFERVHAQPEIMPWRGVSKGLFGSPNHRTDSPALRSPAAAAQVS